MICKRCGKSIKSKSLKCGSCGQKHINKESSGMDFVQSKSHFVTAKRTENFSLQDEAPAFSRKNIAIIAGIAAVATAAVAMLGIVFFKNIDKKENLPKTVVVEDLGNYMDTTVKFSTLGKANITVESDDDAFKALELVSGIYGYTDARAQLRFVRVTPGSETVQYYVFEQVYNNKKVYGKNMIVAVSDEKKVICISGNYQKIEDEIAIGEIKAETAKQTVQKKSGGSIAEPERVILCMNKPVDVWHIELEGGKHVFVDTVTGGIVLEKERDIVTDVDEASAQKVVDNLSEEKKNDIYTTSEMMAIVNPMGNMPFSGIIVSEDLHDIYASLDEGDALKNKLLALWGEAANLLPADADLTDCITAADILADAGMLEMKERQKLLAFFAEKHRYPEGKIEVAGANPKIVVIDADGKPTVNYTYEIYESNANLQKQGPAVSKGSGSEIGENFNFDAEKIYCLIIKENNGLSKEEYIYCSANTNVDYELYTQFKEDDAEVTL